jgi:regulator of sigma E protease
LIEVLEKAGLFVALLGLLVFVHESGHFLAAKLLRIRVEVFSLGFGPRLFGFRRGDTDYRVSLVPLGGYVKMTGEIGGEDAEPDDPRAFSAKPRWARFLVMVAGAAFNVILAVLLWAGLAMHGINVPVAEDGPPTVGVVVPGGPADRAGLRPGDEILAIGSETVEDRRTFQRAMLLNPGATLVFAVRREGERLELPVRLGRDDSTPHRLGDAGLFLRVPFQIVQVLDDSPAAAAGFEAEDTIISVNGQPVESQDHLVQLIQDSSGAPIDFLLAREGETRRVEVVPAREEDGVWRIGVAFGPAAEFLSLGPVGALTFALRTAWEHAGDLFYTLRQLILGRVGLLVMSGPLEIASFLHQTAQLGPIPLIHLLAWISLQLGIINLLPIPVLDGGHIMVLAVEGIARRDLSLRLKERIMIAGLVFLILFMVTVIGLDIFKMVVRMSASGG